MIYFLQEDEKSKESVVVSVDEMNDIFEIMRKFEGFLRNITFSNSVIYHGFKNAVDEMEGTLRCDSNTYRTEVKEESQDCCEDRESL